MKVNQYTGKALTGLTPRYLPPSNPKEGDAYFSENGLMRWNGHNWEAMHIRRVYDGATDTWSTIKTTQQIFKQDTEPTTANEGDIWIDTSA